MDKNFNNLSEDSMRFNILMNENDIWMDVKNILLNEKGRHLFKVEHVLYLMVINCSATQKINIDKYFQEFAIENIKISRAYFYKILKAMSENKMITKLPVRGWYKINHLKKRKYQPIDELSNN